MTREVVVIIWMTEVVIETGRVVAVMGFKGHKQPMIRRYQTYFRGQPCHDYKTDTV